MVIHDLKHPTEATLSLLEELKKGVKVERMRLIDLKRQATQIAAKVDRMQANTSSVAGLSKSVLIKP